MPSTVKNGALTFTLSTGGMPALTRVLSQDLRAYYGSDFAAFNEVYAAFMGEHRPARVCVEVSNIAHGCLLEMDAICFKE